MARRTPLVLALFLALAAVPAALAVPVNSLKVGDSVDVTQTKIGCFMKISADRRALICELATTHGLIKGTYGVGIAANGDTVVSKVNNAGNAIALWGARGKASARAHMATYYELRVGDSFGFQITGGAIGCDIVNIKTGSADFSGIRIVCFHSLTGGKPVPNSYAVVLSNKFAGSFRFTATSGIPRTNAFVKLQPK